MKLENILEEYLKSEPQARERRNKTRALANLLQKLHPSVRNISKDIMVEIVDQIISFDRIWRKLLADNPDLRGSDYETKKVVMQKKMLELGVAEMGYNAKGYHD